MIDDVDEMADNISKIIEEIKNGLKKLTNISVEERKSVRLVINSSPLLHGAGNNEDVESLERSGQVKQ